MFILMVPITQNPVYMATPNSRDNRKGNLYSEWPYTQLNTEICYGKRESGYWGEHQVTFLILFFLCRLFLNDIMTDVNAIQTLWSNHLLFLSWISGSQWKGHGEKAQPDVSQTGQNRRESEEEYGGTEDKTRGGEGAWADQQAWVTDDWGHEGNEPVDAGRPVGNSSQHFIFCMIWKSANYIPPQLPTDLDNGMSLVIFQVELKYCFNFKDMKTDRPRETGEQT